MEITKSLTDFFQSTISPLVLISGVGLILLSLTNRLARTIDRSREMVSEIQNDTSADKENKRIQLRILVKRSYFLKYSITAISFSILSSSLIIPILLIMYLFQVDLSLLGKLFFLLSIIGIIFSAIFLFVDVSFTLKALEIEVKDHL
ncbi:MAG: DUF2721 domain-containing protein [Melioribacteraceae bacterium]|nr:DUF2721 domain-containing protein [Melioribacteraceae bacterium]